MIETDPTTTHIYRSDYDPNKGFRIYRNLHKDCWSVQAYVTGKGWRLWAHTHRILCGDVTFKVNESGRQRVLATGKKNVHAFVVADYVMLGYKLSDRGERALRPDIAAGLPDVVWYNPWQGPQFNATGYVKPIVAAPRAYLDEHHRVWVSVPACTFG